jgi:transposase-like protein
MPQNAPQPRTLTAKQLMAIDALVSGKSLGETAETVGVNRKTLYKWREDPLFQEALHQAQGELHQAAIATLIAASTSAARNLQQIFENKWEPAAARVSAARVVLDFCHKHIDVARLEAKVDEVRALLDGEQTGD